MTAPTATTPEAGAGSVAANAASQPWRQAKFSGAAASVMGLLPRYFGIFAWGFNRR